MEVLSCLLLSPSYPLPSTSSKSYTIYHIPHIIHHTSYTIHHTGQPISSSWSLAAATWLPLISRICRILSSKWRYVSVCVYNSFS
ncbi:hypothetical protein EON63_15260 [archaeon]|nr:MAG: hypothetical protein EON63_15260 [archaeon]